MNIAEIKDRYTITALKEYIKKSEFTRNVLTLITGAMIAQIIPILVTPLLTRLYTPEDFGLLAIYVSVVSIFAILSSGRYESAIMLPEKDKEAANILFMCLFLTLIFSIFLSVLFIIFNSKITLILGNSKISPCLYCIGIPVFFLGYNQAQIYWFNRRKKFQEINNNKIIYAFFSVLISLGLGITGYTEKGLIISYIFALTISTLFLGIQFLQKDYVFIKFVSIKEMIRLGKRFINFPKYTMWALWLNSFSFKVPFFLLSSFFNNSIVGFYSLSHKLITIPANTIGNSITPVFHQKAAELRVNSEKLKNLTFKTYKRLLLIGTLPTAVLIVYGDILFKIIFGEKWIIAGQFAQILGVFFLLNFVSSPISILWSVLEKQKHGLILNIMFFLSRSLPFLIGILFFKDYMFIMILFGVTCALYRLFLCLYTLKLVGVKYSETLVYTIHSILFPIIIVYFTKILFL